MPTISRSAELRLGNLDNGGAAEGARSSHPSRPSNKANEIGMHRLEKGHCQASECLVDPVLKPACYRYQKASIPAIYLVTAAAAMLAGFLPVTGKLQYILSHGRSLLSITSGQDVYAVCAFRASTLLSGTFRDDVAEVSHNAG